MESARRPARAHFWEGPNSLLISHLDLAYIGTPTVSVDSCISTASLPFMCIQTPKTGGINRVHPVGYGHFRDLAKCDNSAITVRTVNLDWSLFAASCRHPTSADYRDHLVVQPTAETGAVERLSAVWREVPMNKSDSR